MLDVMLTTCWSSVTTNPEQEVPDPRVRPALTTWVTPPPPTSCVHRSAWSVHRLLSHVTTSRPDWGLRTAPVPEQGRPASQTAATPARPCTGLVPALYWPCNGTVPALYRHCSSLPLTSPPKSAWNACGAAEWPRPVHRFQQTRYTDPMLVQCWASCCPNIEPTLVLCIVNRWWPLGGNNGGGQYVTSAAHPGVSLCPLPPTPGVRLCPPLPDPGSGCAAGRRGAVSSPCSRVPDVPDQGQRPLRPALPIIKQVGTLPRGRQTDPSCVHCFRGPRLPATDHLDTEAYTVYQSITRCDWTKLHWPLSCGGDLF